MLGVAACEFRDPVKLGVLVKAGNTSFHGLGAVCLVFKAAGVWMPAFEQIARLRPIDCDVSHSPP